MTTDDASAGIRQKAHHEWMHDAYEAHYHDATSLAYRDRLLLEPLLRGLDLEAAHLLDVACASGFTTLALRRRFPRLTATGLDISASTAGARRRCSSPAGGGPPGSIMRRS